ncbi:hypothetical protein DI392_17520 [Vibrio albus]|uniref:Uncharacterized protein n=1 Tax=Vibrio albus TaxID=2200953 RepID=A0A2U3B5U4_9VIBR|nr:hypothetical protein [Vibrio albus]PWI32159.1 hypothetical protein DI392_17520 [Vibrio albus]
MRSLEELLNSWGLWKATGEIIHVNAGGSFFQDKIQTTRYQSIALLQSDKPQKLIDTLINHHLTKRQREVIRVEYRASENIPHFKNSEQKAHYIQLTGGAYRERLRRAKSVLNSCLDSR